MRVVAGRLGGRRLVAPRGRATRPTAERVREALFALLGPLDGARVVDLYAGTGALGIEAISRGAARAVFVEADREALLALRRNLDALAINAQTCVVATRVERAARRLRDEGPFELVLADPPYAAVEAGEATRALAALVRAGALAAGGIVALEHATRGGAPSIPDLETLETRAYGDASITLYRRARG